MSADLRTLRVDAIHMVASSRVRLADRQPYVSAVNRATSADEIRAALEPARAAIEAAFGAEDARVRKIFGTKAASVPTQTSSETRPSPAARPAAPIDAAPAVDPLEELLALVHENALAGFGHSIAQRAKVSGQTAQVLELVQANGLAGFDHERVAESLPEPTPATAQTADVLALIASAGLSGFRSAEAPTVTRPPNDPVAEGVLALARANGVMATAPPM